MLIILSCIAIVIEYAETMLFPAIPNIIDEFKIDYNTSSWILSGYLITAAVMAPIAGKLSDTYGKKKILIIIMSIFIVSIIIAGFSYNASTLIASRFVQGIGLSMFIISLSILQSEVPKEKYALANGILASLYFSGSSIGLIVGGAIIHYADWRVTFFSLVPLLGILYVVTLKFLKVKYGKQGLHETKLSGLPLGSNLNYSPNTGNDNIPSSSAKGDIIDIKGAISLAVSITFFLLALSYLEVDEGSPTGASSPSITSFTTFLAISVISVVVFVIMEKKSSSPLIDLKFITNGSILPLLITFLIMGFSLFTIYQTIPILVKEPSPIGFGGTALTSSLVLLPFTTIFLVLSPFVGKIISKLGNLVPFVIACIISFIGFISIYSFHSSEVQVSISLGIISTGLALINTIAMNIVLILTPKQFGGIVVGIVQVFTFTGMALGPVISGFYLENYQISVYNMSRVTIMPSSEAYEMIFLTTAIASFTLPIMAIILKKTIPNSISKT